MQAYGLIIALWPTPQGQRLVYIGLLERIFAVKLRQRDDAIHLCHVRWCRLPANPRARLTAVQWPDRDPRRSDQVLELPARFLPDTADPIMETLNLLGRVVCVKSRDGGNHGGKYTEGQRLWCEDVDLDHLKYSYRASVNQ